MKSYYNHIRNIGRIRPQLIEESCKTLFHALVTSHLKLSLWKCTSLWSPTDDAEAITKGANLYCSPHYPYKKTCCALNGLAPVCLAELINYRPINKTLRYVSSAFIRTCYTDCHTSSSPFRCLLSRYVEH